MPASPNPGQADSGQGAVSARSQTCRQSAAFIKTKNRFAPARRRNNTPTTDIGEERRSAAKLKSCKQRSMLDKARVAGSAQPETLMGQTRQAPGAAARTLHPSRHPPAIRCAGDAARSTKGFDDTGARAEKAMVLGCRRVRQVDGGECERLAAAHTAIIKHGFNKLDLRRTVPAAQNQGDARRSVSTAAAAAESLCRITSTRTGPQTRCRAPEYPSHQRHRGDRGEHSRSDAIGTASEAQAGACGRGGPNYLTSSTASPSISSHFGQSTFGE